MKQRLTADLVRKLVPGDRRQEYYDESAAGLMLRVYPPSRNAAGGRKVWFYCYRNRAGRKRKLRLGDASVVPPEQARNTVKVYAGQVASGGDPQAGVQAQRVAEQIRKESTLRAFLEDHYRPGHLDRLKSGAATLDRLHKCWGHLLDRELAEITRREVERWRSDQVKAGKAASTVNRDVTVLRGALSKAVEWGALDVHPLAYLKPLKIDRRAKVRYLTRKENQRLRTALDERETEKRQARDSANAWRRERGYDEFPPLGWFADHLKPLVLLALNTGMRRGELFSLRWENVALDRRELTIEGRLAKSGGTRHLPLTEEATDVLRKWRRGVPDGPGNLVFPAEDGSQLDNINSAWSGLLKRASIESFRFHDLRHDFASQLVMKGVPLNTVRELLGHSDMTTTLRYAHLAPDHKREAIELLNAGVTDA